MKFFLVLFTAIVFYTGVNAQDSFTISGTVKNEKGELLQAATVFIAGTEKATATNDQGSFKFTGLSGGTYQLIVNMLGYTPTKQNIILTNKSETVDITLSLKTIVLNDVVIGNKSAREKQIKTFEKYFLGQTINSGYCKILNPEIIEFSTSKLLLKATTPDFLIIENSRLGYRIKYLLKSFQYDYGKDVTNYDGDYIFEKLTGTSKQQSDWEKNRKEAYEGSLMHYLRSLYARKTRQEGFLVYKILSQFFPLLIETIPIPAEQLVRHPDSTLMTFKFKMRFYILYDKKAAAKPDKYNGAPNFVLNNLDATGSIFMTDAKVDSRGSYTDYKELLIQGFWGEKRVGDQLPFEYDPDKP